MSLVDRASASEDTLGVTDITKEEEEEEGEEAVELHRNRKRGCRARQPNACDTRLFTFGKKKRSQDQLESKPDDRIYLHVTLSSLSLNGFPALPNFKSIK